MFLDILLKVPQAPLIKITIKRKNKDEGVREWSKNSQQDEENTIFLICS
jgi:hypothetical protein